MTTTQEMLNVQKTALIVTIISLTIIVLQISTPLNPVQTFSALSFTGSVIPVGFDTSDVIIDQSFSIFGVTHSDVIKYVAPSGTEWEVTGAALSMTGGVQKADMSLDGVELSRATRNTGDENTFPGGIRGKTILIGYEGGQRDEASPDFLNVVIAGSLSIEGMEEPSPVPIPDPEVPPTVQPVSFATQALIILLIVGVMVGATVGIMRKFNIIF